MIHSPVVERRRTFDGQLTGKLLDIIIGIGGRDTVGYQRASLDLVLFDICLLFYYDDSIGRAVLHNMLRFRALCPNHPREVNERGPAVRPLLSTCHAYVLPRGTSEHLRPRHR